MTGSVSHYYYTSVSITRVAVPTVILLQVSTISGSVSH
jgi:hypothetical protein